MRTEPETRGSSPCHRGPSLLSWSGKVPPLTRTPSPPVDRLRVPGSGGFCWASCLIWGIPRWKGDLYFCFCTFSRVTGYFYLLGPPPKSPPEQPRTVIPAQDSLRTTEVPCKRLWCRSSRCCFSLRAFAWGLLCYCRCSSHERTDLLLLQSNATSSHLVLPHAYESGDVLHVTQAKQFLIGRSPCDTAVVHFMRCGSWQM